MTTDVAICRRCGIHNQARDPHGYLCASCKAAVRDDLPIHGRTESNGAMMSDTLALPPGRWRYVAGVMRFEPANPEQFAEYRRTSYIWSGEQLKRAHAAWTRGVRNDWAIEGERLYQREKKRQQRARRREAA